MSYATQADLVERFGEAEMILLTDRADPPAGSIDGDVVAKGLADADALINSYIRTRIETPVNPVPGILTQMACVIARYFLHSERPSEKVQKDYDQAIAWCKDIAAGRAALGDASSAIDPPSAGAPQVSEGCRVFDERALRGF
jgi:phage gp36-like protein